MMRVMLRRRRGALLACVAFLSTTMTGPVTAAQISERAKSLQICLDSRYETWLNGRAELAVNDDPKAGDIDDVSVAKWVVETLTSCRAQAGERDQPTEERFMKRVAQWRQHIYDRVQSIRELARPD